MTRAEMFALFDAEIAPEVLAEDVFFHAALGAHLKVWVARHAIAARAFRMKQREPDPNGGPPEGGTPGAAAGPMPFVITQKRRREIPKGT